MPGQVVITIGMTGLARANHERDGSADATMKSSGMAASSFALPGRRRNRR